MVFVKLVEFKMVDVFGNVEFHISAFDNMTDIIRFMNENRILDNIEIYPTDILSGYVSSDLYYSEEFFDYDWSKLFSNWLDRILN